LNTCREHHCTSDGSYRAVSVAGVYDYSGGLGVTDVTFDNYFAAE